MYIFFSNNKWPSTVTVRVFLLIFFLRESNGLIVGSSRKTVSFYFLQLRVFFQRFINVPVFNARAVFKHDTVQTFLFSYGQYFAFRDSRNY